ncbi:MAG: zinc-binding dehydrogenase [Candidatus Tectomicrobia bacterium]|nr:zinc-binding dehydrogenase [Candidatus Tectomicrobia bacterium]
MTQMKAAFFDGSSAMTLADIPTPEPGPGDAIIRVRATGICGSDLLMNADKTEPDPVPFGHEVAGEIVEVGAGVDRSCIGQRVAIETIGHGLACGKCWYCRQGQYKQCVQKAADEGGGFAQYMKRRAFGCYPLVENLSWEDGALVEPFAVSIHGVRRGQLQGGETVVVLGAGNIGLTAVAAARTLGAGRIFVTARHAQQAEMARSLGADEVLSPEGTDLQEAVEAATEGRGADMTIETVGGRSGDTLQQAIEVTRMQGRIVVLGGFRRPITLDWLPPLIKEHSFVFAICYSILNGQHDYELAIDLLSSGKVPLQQIITHKFPLEEIQQGFATAYDKTTGSIKVQIHQA